MLMPACLLDILMLEGLSLHIINMHENTACKIHVFVCSCCIVFFIQWLRIWVHVKTGNSAKILDKAGDKVHLSLSCYEQNHCCRTKSWLNFGPNQVEGHTFAPAVIDIAKSHPIDISGLWFRCHVSRKMLHDLNSKAGFSDVLNTRSSCSE